MSTDLRSTDVNKIIAFLGLITMPGCFAMNVYEQNLLKAIDSLNIPQVINYVKRGTHIEWKDKTGRNSFDHLARLSEQRVSVPNDSERQRKIEAIRKILQNQRDKLFYWKILYHNVDIIKAMVHIGASPHYYIPAAHKTALEFAHDLFIHEQNDTIKADRQSIYYYLKGVEDHYQADKLAREKAASQHNAIKPDEDHLESLGRLADQLRSGAVTY